MKPAPVRILDIASGAGDIPIATVAARKTCRREIGNPGNRYQSQKHRIRPRQADRSQASIGFMCTNALTDELPRDFDVVMCSLFLHHLSNEDAAKLLQRMASATRCLGLVSDLRRSSYGLFLAYAASRLLSRSPVVHVDAVRSVRAAFTMDELGRLADEAGIPPERISRQWPARMLLTWRTRNHQCRD